MHKPRRQPSEKHTLSHFLPSNLHIDVSVETKKENDMGRGWRSDCVDGVADKRQRRRNKCSCDTNYGSHAVLLWAPAVRSIVRATQNNTALLARSSAWKKKMKMLLCDCSRGWRNESAVIKSACKCIQASRRHIDFSISDWLSPSAHLFFQRAMWDVRFGVVGPLNW